MMFRTGTLRSILLLLFTPSAVSAEESSAPVYFKTDEFKHLNGSQCVPFAIFPDLTCPESPITGTAGSATVTLYPDKKTETPTIEGVEGPLGPTVTISFNMTNLDGRCRDDHHSRHLLDDYADHHNRHLIDHDSGSNSTGMYCGLALHESCTSNCNPPRQYPTCDELWGKAASICGPRREANESGVDPPEIGKIAELCPLNATTGKFQSIPTAFSTWYPIKYEADEDGNAVGTVELFFGIMTKEKLDGLPLVFYDHDGVQIACAEIHYVENAPVVSNSAEDDEGQTDDATEDGHTHDPAEDEETHDTTEGGTAKTSGVSALLMNSFKSLLSTFLWASIGVPFLL